MSDYMIHAAQVPSPSELKLTQRAGIPGFAGSSGVFPSGNGSMPAESSFPADSLSPNFGDVQPGYIEPNGAPYLNGQLPENSFPGSAAPNGGPIPDSGFFPAGQSPDNGFPAVGQTPNFGFPPAGQSPDNGFPSAGQTPGSGFPQAGQTPGNGFPPAGQSPNNGFPPAGQSPNNGFPSAGQSPDNGVSPGGRMAAPDAFTPGGSDDPPAGVTAPEQTPQPIDAQYAGEMKISVVSSLGLIPIVNAAVTIYDTGEPNVPLQTLTTDISGQTETVELPAPPLQWSQEPTDYQPYSEYNITVTAEGYEPVLVSGSEVFADQLSLQPIRMNPLEVTEDDEKVVIIPAHTLFAEYPPKIPEDEIKPMAETGEIVLSRVVIPEYVIVHDGVPSDSTATNYWVRYKDYIKNVASCEIYSTWEEAAIYANVLAIMSFTLNRVYTEWYRNQGYDFTITTSTAYDQKWVYGRNIYENIDYLVDTIFANYLSRPGVRQPIFTSYCDGRRVTCSGLSQWGSQYLAEQGYSAIEIIRYYYGNDMYINTADVISGVPSSWPGYNLTIGSAGDKVRQLQAQLNRIAQNYPAIPTVVADGIYGPATEEAVRTFQRVFGLPQTGVTDYATWYAISDIYVGVTRIAEPD